MEIKSIVEKQKEYFKLNQTKELEFRIKNLKKLKENIKFLEGDILDALEIDLGKSSYEGYMTEVGIIYASIDYFIKNIYKFSKIKKVRTPIYQFGKSYIEYLPYGVNLIIAPFNYPFQLAMEPLIAAVACGNTVVLKPSEYTPNVSKQIKKLISMTFESELVACIEGEVNETQELLAQDVDFIFFTGSPNVGKIVMEAAAKKLTPICLELGGKSPVIVDETANIKLAARHIIWGKLMNAGQTCIAPDYLLVSIKIREKLVNELIASIKEFYGENIQQNKDYGKIVNEKHFNRLMKMLKQDGEHVVFGGKGHRDELFIEPTLIFSKNIDIASMQEEIFGPILPIFEYEDFEEIFKITARNEKPLALYIFSTKDDNIKRISQNILSGNVSINDTIKHVSNINLPFGGVGKSGIGAYHGKYSFDTFSHIRGVYRNTLPFDFSVIFPPYTEKKWKLLNKIFK